MKQKKYIFDHCAPPHPPPNKQVFHIMNNLYATTNKVCLQYFTLSWTCSHFSLHLHHIFSKHGGLNSRDKSRLRSIIIKTSINSYNTRHWDIKISRHRDLVFETLHFFSIVETLFWLLFEKFSIDFFYPDKDFVNTLKTSHLGNLTLLIMNIFKALIHINSFSIEIKIKCCWYLSNFQFSTDLSNKLETFGPIFGIDCLDKRIDFDQ